jgi:hypothetical protein
VAHGDMYCAWGDGGGFGGDDHVGGVSLRFARVAAVPSPLDALSYGGKNIWGLPPYAEVPAKFAVARSAGWWPLTKSSTRWEAFLHAGQQPGSHSRQRT